MRLSKMQPNLILGLMVIHALAVWRTTSTSSVYSTECVPAATSAPSGSNSTTRPVQPVACANPTALCQSLFPTTGGSQLFASSCQQVVGETMYEELTCQCLPTPVSEWLDVTIAISSGPGGCKWNSTFDEAGMSGGKLPSGQQTCGPLTGRCPSRSDCNNAASAFSSGTCSNGRFSCTSPDPMVTRAGNLTNVSLILRCYTCEGGDWEVYVEESSGRCFNDYVPPSFGSACVPATTCFGHGCCAPVGDVGTVGVCNCYADGVRGYWSASSQCSFCDSSYETQVASAPCTTSKSTIVVLLQTLGETTAVMIVPNLLIILLFCLFTGFRAVWPDDRTFPMTVQRRAGLPWCRNARAYVTDGDYLSLPVLGGSYDAPPSTASGFQHDPSATTSALELPQPTSPHNDDDVAKFHLKAIPKRPRTSQGFINRWEAIQASRQRL